MGDKMEGVASTGDASDPKQGVPITTVYVNNINEFTPIDTLVPAFEAIFKHCGTVLEVVAKRSVRRKGQAFVVFDTETAAQEALKLNGFEVFGTKLRVELAKTHSDATVRTRAPANFEEHKRKRLTQKDFKRAQEDAKAKTQADPSAPTDKPRAKPGANSLIPDEYVRPNKTLFVQNIPYEAEESDLTALFEHFEGFKEVRYVKLRRVAFVEFESEQFSITAKEQTADARVGKEILKITYKRA